MREEEVQHVQRTEAFKTRETEARHMTPTQHTKATRYPEADTVQHALAASWRQETRTAARHLRSADTRYPEVVTVRHTTAAPHVTDTADYTQEEEMDHRRRSRRKIARGMYYV